MLQAIEISVDSMFYASDRLLNSWVFMQSAVTIYVPYKLQCTSASLSIAHHFQPIITGITSRIQQRYALQAAGEISLYSDPEIVSAAIHQNGRPCLRLQNYELTTIFSWHR